MSSVPTNYLTATETLRLIKEGTVTAEQVIADHKRRYEERNEEVRAWVNVDYEAATQAAKDTKGLPLHGVMIAVKDIINTKDMPTEQGSRIYKGSRPGVDAAIVGLLRAAGASILGKTTTSEFAAGDLHDPTGNPFDTNHFAGASSAGSGAAVSDYQSHVALGSQTAASLMRPAGYCGIFGYKPTWGRVCLDGVKSLAPTGDTIGFLARSLYDIELIGGVLGLFHNASRNPVTLKGCKFAFIESDQFALKATTDLQNIWAQAKSLLSSAGAEVVDLDLGPKYEGWMGEHGRYTRMCRAEGGISMQRELVTGRELMGADLPAWVENDIPAKEVLRSRDDLGALRPDFDAIAARYDAIITPTLADTAPGKESGGDPYFGSLWTGLHAPSIHVPGFAGENGLPIGLTLVSSRYADEKLLQVAKAVAGVFIGAENGQLRKVPAPEGVVHIKP